MPASTRSRKSRAPGAYLAQVRGALVAKFSEDRITVYRYNSAAIRVRVIDRSFHGLSIPERERIVLPLIRKLPDEVQSEITVLLLLSPQETRTSMMNLEFEDPKRSKL